MSKVSSVSETNLTYVYGAWLMNYPSSTDQFFRVSEIFDEFIIVKDAFEETWMVPYVGSEKTQNAVFGPHTPITVDYFFLSDDTLLDRLKKTEHQLSRPASGKACLLTLQSGETISVVTEGYLEDIYQTPVTAYNTL